MRLGQKGEHSDAGQNKQAVEFADVLKASMAALGRPVEAGHCHTILGITRPTVESAFANGIRNAQRRDGAGKRQMSKLFHKNNDKVLRRCH